MKISSKQNDSIPIVAVANYGQHSSLNAIIVGMKNQLQKEGFIEGKTIQYQIVDVGFDTALIPQMVQKLKSYHPQVVVALTTPIAQYVKNSIKDRPVIFSAITDPVDAGLLKNTHKPEKNITGSSDRQDLSALLSFAKALLPKAHRIGLFYATAESNDRALVDMMTEAAKKYQMQVISIPVDQQRDIPLRIQLFKDKVDFLYVGSSGPIQPSLPIIAIEARKMGIPVFNLDEEAVKNHLVLASYGVNYARIGEKTGTLVAAILNGNPVEMLDPIYPEIQDHDAYVSEKQAHDFGIEIPKDLPYALTILRS
jgi:putative ABC transport system substrate-binding protein